MTEPYISASPWAFYRRFASRCNSDCASLCAGYNVRTSVLYRLSLFLGGLALIKCKVCVGGVTCVVPLLCIDLWRGYYEIEKYRITFFEFVDEN